MTRLCVAIFVTDAARTRRDIAAAAEAGADMVELRIDDTPLLDDLPALASLVHEADLPCIVTCRPPREGGQSRLSDDARVAILRQLAPHTTYLDFELDALGGVAELLDQPRDRRPGVIASAHDFTGRPDRLYNTLSEMAGSAADISKVVWTARSIRDNAEAFEILSARSKPMIVLCMGEDGLLSRVLAKKFDAFLTFASLDPAGGTAPGQVSIEQMKQLYRWDAIGPATRVFGVVGSPVSHSMSPAIHNAAFGHIGFDGVYLPMLVNEGYESFKAFMETFVREPHALAIDGLSITIPHKENALRYLDELGPAAAEIEPLARRIGAVNTIIVRRDAQRTTLVGKNTDYGAILDTITSSLNIERSDLAGRRVAVIGAGGTGRTAVAALAEYGATVVIYNRTRERADTLAREFAGEGRKIVAADIEKLCDSCCSIYINTTSVGMHPHVDVSPWGDRMPALGPDSLVFDVIYNPPQTRFLKQAADAGAKVASGIDMFVRQAAGQFSAWTNQSAPVEIMRQVVERRLGIRQ